MRVWMVAWNQNARAHSLFFEDEKKATEVHRQVESWGGKNATLFGPSPLKDDDELPAHIRESLRLYLRGIEVERVAHLLNRVANLEEEINILRAEKAGAVTK